MLSNYPNQRGSAKRSENKKIRLGTHIDVLDMCLSSSKISEVLEHGMGVVSTQHFHKTQLPFVSLENIPKWRNCVGCDVPKQKTLHTIMSYDNVEKAFESVTPDSLVFVDGPGVERLDIVSRALSLSVEYVVEHDAETMSPNELNERKLLCDRFGYVMYQYIAKNPETMLYARTKPLFVDDELFMTHDNKEDSSVQKP